MADTTSNEASLPVEPPITTTEHEARLVQFGKIYDKLEANKSLDIMVFGSGKLTIDVENLGLENVSLESLLRAWESKRDTWTARCKELGIEMDPFTVFKFHHIQRKAFQILGAPTTNRQKERNKRYVAEDVVPLSTMKGMAMCSEYAVLETFIAQKIGEQVHLIVGTTVVGESKWREAHMYTWIDGINAVLEGTLAVENEFPALMVATNDETLQVLEQGFDVECQRIGTKQTAIYGLEAGGFGASFGPQLPDTLQKVANG